MTHEECAGPRSNLRSWSRVDGIAKEGIKISRQMTRPTNRSGKVSQPPMLLPHLIITLSCSNLAEILRLRAARGPHGSGVDCHSTSGKSSLSGPHSSHASVVSCRAGSMAISRELHARVNFNLRPCSRMLRLHSPCGLQDCELR